MRVKMSKQPPPAPTARAVGPCPTPIQTSRTHWKFTQNHRTTRLSPKNLGSIILKSVQSKKKRAIMALGRSPEYHWNQIISKSVHRLSRRSRLKLFSIYSPGGHFIQQSGTVCRQSPNEHSCIIISKSMHLLRRGVSE